MAGKAARNVQNLKYFYSCILFKWHFRGHISGGNNPIELPPPSDPCASCTGQVNIADPSDPTCKTFLTCVNGVSRGMPTTCPQGAKFNPDIQGSELTDLLHPNVAICGSDIRMLGTLDRFLGVHIEYPCRLAITRPMFKTAASHLLTTAPTRLRQRTCQWGLCR